MKKITKKETVEISEYELKAILTEDEVNILKQFRTVIYLIMAMVCSSVKLKLFQGILLIDRLLREESEQNTSTSQAQNNPVFEYTVSTVEKKMSRIIDIVHHCRRYNLYPDGTNYNELEQSIKNTGILLITDNEKRAKFMYEALSSNGFKVSIKRVAKGQ